MVLLQNKWSECCTCMLGHRSELAALQLAEAGPPVVFLCTCMRKIRRLTGSHADGMVGRVLSTSGGIIVYNPCQHPAQWKHVQPSLGNSNLGAVHDLLQG